MRRFFFIGLAGFLAAGSEAQALSWNAYDPHRHLRFLRGLPSRPEPNPGFLAARYDLSGIGWDASDGVESVALISPRHFLGAKHWQLRGMVSFLGRDGRVRTFEIARHETIGLNNDISIGVLQRPIEAADQIAHYPIAAPEAFEPYPGRTVLYFGQSGGAGRAVVKRIIPYEDGRMTEVFQYHGLLDEPKGDGVMGTSNDSGSPSFLVEGGRLVLLGHHYMNVRDSFLPGYAREILAILAKDGYRLEVVRLAGAAETEADHDR